MRKSMGPTGRILRVDLSRREWKFEEIPPEVIRDYLGGIGLAARILFAETGPSADPFGPENVVIVSAGFLNGTEAPTAYRAEVTTKSPLTGLAGTGNFGGLLGARLKKAGIEAIALKGRASGPTYLVIDDGHIELRAAHYLWGKDTFETAAAVRGELGEDFSVMAIGQAGENLVRFACPVADCHHTPGRCHAGGVMGSKNLKAIAVRGTREIPIARREEFREASDRITERIRSYPERGIRQEVGSISKVVDAARKGTAPAHNYQTGLVPSSNELWRPEDFKQYLRTGPVLCGECPLSAHYGCNQMAEVREGPYQSAMQGISFSFLVWDWGSKCGIENLPAMIKCKEMCNRYGLDQAGTIPFALELFQRGIITRADLGGAELRWGNAEDILRLMADIAHRRGLGDVLAEGSARAARVLGQGAEQCALTIKDMETMATPDPRGDGRGKHLGNLISVRGGDDVKTTHTIFEGLPAWAAKQGMSEEEYTQWFLDRLDMFPEVKEKIYGVPPNIYSTTYTPERIALLVKWYEDLSMVRDSLGICLFGVQTTSAIGPTESARLFSACLGVPVSPQALMRAGERIVNLLKAYNLRQGWARQDATWPERFFTEPLKNGTATGPVISKTELSGLIDSYHELRDWDRETGVPRRSKLEDLGLNFVVAELQKSGAGIQE
jgi:aldehyde:ferredoxin oxidoreductase